MWGLTVDAQAVLSPFQMYFLSPVFKLWLARKSQQLESLSSGFCPGLFLGTTFCQGWLSLGGVVGALGLLAGGVICGGSEFRGGGNEEWAGCNGGWSGVLPLLSCLDCPFFPFLPSPRLFPEVVAPSD